MHDVTIVRIQRLCLQGSPGTLDRIRKMANFRNEDVVSHRSMMINIDNHARRFGIAGLENAIKEELQVVQRLLAPTNEALGFVGENLENFMPFALLFFNFENKA